jgi:hypothetical protein
MSTLKQGAASFTRCTAANLETKTMTKTAFVMKTLDRLYLTFFLALAATPVVALAAVGAIR